MAGLAVLFAGIAYFAGNSWLQSQADARQAPVEAAPAVAMTTVAVAAAQLRFGENLSEEKIKIVPWPKDALPDGAYETMEAVLGNGERRAIKTIEAGEPLLAVKLTGENGKAGLSGVIADGMRAVTIPVDHVNGVGGFVMPGDRVDIVLTRKNRENGEQSAKIIMQNVKVLSIDQDADRAGEVARVAKSVTLETDAGGAQRLALANSVGRLSLMLRGAGDEQQAGANELSADELNGRPTQAGADAGGGLFSFLKAEEKKVTTVRVVRGEDVTAHSVPIMKGAQDPNTVR